ncbi:EpsI family protein [Sphingobium sp. H39-3-25]|uniref:exosortase A n=1 Tax=Sphingobium arseniciresistens TaxID=3030834 RepID=UPI0023B9D333|nr:EpsI family protein [Sphingobium arseniciresistens]
MNRIAATRSWGSFDLTGWRLHLAALGALWALILTVFARDAIGMVTIWWTASTFGHCLFIPFLIAWLVQQRLPGLRQLDPAAWAPGLLWLAAGGFGWLLGDAGGVALFRHAGLVIMAQGAVIATLGPAASRALMFPIFYALFMIPFGEEIVPPLQLLTARLAMILLDLFAVPAHVDGIFITTPTGYFEVAEACSGAKFVIAMSAYGALVCNVCFRTWPRRIVFMGAALSLSVLANGVRAFATIYVAHLTSVDAAVGFDHVVYGWVFFAIVLTIIMAVGWRFFDRRPGDPWFDPAVLQGRSGGGSLARTLPFAVLLILAAPLWSLTMSSRTMALPAAPQLPAVPGWSTSAAPTAYPWKPRFDGADHLLQRRYVDARGQVVDLAIALYDRQEEARELVGFGQGAADPDSGWTWSSPAPAPAGGLGAQITAPGPVIRHVVTFYALGGIVTGSAGAVKLETLKARLLGGDQRAVAILISAEAREGYPADAAIAAFLRDLGSIKELADASAGIR